jgi:hypothetical protein
MGQKPVSGVLIQAVLAQAVFAELPQVLVEDVLGRSIVLRELRGVE